MKTMILSEVKQPLLSLMSGIVYKNAPYWYGVTSLPLKLSLILPKAAERPEKRPLIVWLCGGSFQQMDENLWLPEMVFYARNGYAVAGVEYRCTGEMPWPAAVEDVRAAIRYLRAHSDLYGIDPNRVAIMGESAGGYLASFVGAARGKFDVGDWLDVSGDVQAVVDYYGPCDMSGREGSMAGRFVEHFTPEQLREVDPKTHITRDTPPYLIFHGEKDPLVPLWQSEKLHDALTAAGVRADFYIVEGEGHGTEAFYQPPIKQIVLDFLNDVLEVRP